MAKKASLRSRTRVEQNSFVKGLITEANPLNFPPDASLREENFFLSRDGSRRRRLGIDYEIGYNLHPVDKEDTVLADIDSFIWKNAANSRSFNIAVVRTGSQFYFFEGDADVVSTRPMQAIDLNLNLLPRGRPLTLPSLEINGVNLNTKYDVAFVHGYLIVVSGLQEFYILSYDVQRDVITAIRRRIQIRDHFGVEESTLGTDTFFDSRPSSADFTDPFELDIQHRYNLRNQGWREQLDSAFYEDGTPPKATLRAGADTIAFTAEINGFYPSNADVIWAHKVSFGTGDPKSIGAYAPEELKKSTRGKTRAPNGRYIIDVFNRGDDRKRQMSEENIGYPVEQIPKDRTLGGITSVASYLGRIVFTVNEFSIEEPDERSPALGSMVFFSKISDKISDLNDCFADGDPTSGDEFTPLATDGGFFTITGVGHVNNMEVLGNSLFVFSDRGVWQINGGDRIATPTNINLTQVTSVGSIGHNSTVIVENNIFYLTDAGIYILPLGQEANTSIPQNISQTTIQTFWESIPESQREFITASYDRFARQVKWLIRLGDTPNRNFYDTELIYDLNLEAFIINTIKPITANFGSPYVVGFLERNSVVQAVEDIQILQGFDLVVAGVFPDEEPVVIRLRDVSEDFITSNKYWTIEERPTEVNSALTVSEYRNLQFRDWGSITDINGIDGVDAKAFLLTGYATAGDSSVFKRVTTLSTFMARTERQLFEIGDGFESDNPSSCQVQAQWEWTNRPESGRWSNPQQAYKLPRTFIPDNEEFNYGHTVVVSKLNLRGKGRALSLLFETEPYKDCHIHGWSIEINAEQDV